MMRTILSPVNSWQRQNVGPYNAVKQPTAVLKKAAVVSQPSNVFTCTSLDQWCRPEASDYQGLRVARSIASLQWQPVADRILQTMGGNSMQDDTLYMEMINLAMPDAALKQKVRDAAWALSKSCCLPPDLANLICEDAQALSFATKQMVPQGKELIMKLELFGTNVCGRWHQDNYVCRSLVAYNCSGTEYTDDSNVDFYEMEYCGNNDHIIKDKRQIRCADVGDIVMIKGKKFPGKAKGLVHKSPEVQYYENGCVQPRILLKVDVLDTH